MSVSPAERGELWRRVQIGLAGLALVVMLVSVADLALDRVTAGQEPPVPGTEGVSAPPPVANEPLVDLGVSPVPSEPTGAPTAGLPAAPPATPPAASPAAN